MIGRSLLLKVLRTYPKLARTCPRHLSAHSDPYTVPDRCLYERSQASEVLDQSQPEEDLETTTSQKDLDSQNIIDDDEGAAPPVSEFYEDDEVSQRLMSNELIYPEKEVPPIPLVMGW